MSQALGLEQLLLKNDSEKFITTLTGDIDSDNLFAVIKESHANNGKKKVFHFRGTLRQHYIKLKQYNLNGFGIYVTVNKCNDKKRTAKNITKIRAVFFDDDDNQNLNLPLQPNLFVQSINGKHGYYLTEDEIPLVEFTLLQKAISNRLNTDPAVSDLPRLMRFAGFLHWKDSQNPRVVKIIDTRNEKYTFEEIKNAFQYESLIENRSHSKSTVEINSQKNLHHFKSWCDDLPLSEGSDNHYGGRNNTVLRLVREGLAQGLTNEQIAQYVQQYCIKSGLDYVEVEEMILRQSNQHISSGFKSFLKKSEKLNVLQLSEMFLKKSGYLTDGGQSLLAYWRSGFYKYNGISYEKITVADLKASITECLINDESTKDRFKKSIVEEVISALSGFFHIPSHINAGSDLNNPLKKQHLIFLKNCILLLDQEKNFKAKVLKPDKKYFTLVAQPYNYHPKRKCNEFLKILKQIVPDEETRLFIQEWFGYNLIYDTSFQKFVIFCGDGANGKSVLLSILIALLGAENVSAVPLENFVATRTFPLATTMGKLANVVDEIGNIKGVEATVKQYVSGSMMNVERKGVDALDQKPTARLTFATNTIPRFQDLSEGLWRRLILIPMTVQILDVKKQNKNLAKIEHWQNSKELEGILNWSIEGLQRLMRRGHFIEPQSSLNEKNEFRRDSDRVSDFIEDRLSYDLRAKCGCSDLYTEYKIDCDNKGIVPLSAASFTAVIKKTFPKAIKSKNVIRTVRPAQRIWTGLKLSGGDL